MAADAAGAAVCAKQGGASSRAGARVDNSPVNRVRIMEKDTDAVFDPAILGVLIPQ
jgi:hypothetical protein